MFEIVLAFITNTLTTKSLSGVELFCNKKAERRKSLSMQKFSENEIFFRHAEHLRFNNSISNGWVQKLGWEGDIMPGIQLIKFSVFELLSAIFTRFASVHFRVLFQPAPWIALRPKKGERNFPNFLGWKAGRNDKCDNLDGVRKEAQKRQKTARGE